MLNFKFVLYGLLGMVFGSFIFYANKVYEDSKKYRTCVEQFQQLEETNNVLQNNYERYLQKSLELEAELNNSLAQQDILKILQGDGNETDTFDSIIRVKF